MKKITIILALVGIIAVSFGAYNTFFLEKSQWIILFFLGFSSLFGGLLTIKKSTLIIFLLIISLMAMILSISLFL